MNVKKLCRTALIATLCFVLQVALAPLPNIEVVSIILLCYTMVFGAEAILVAEVFGILEITVWGFGLWNIMYIYVWLVLVLLTLLFKDTISKHWWFAIVVNVLFGMMFGTLCSLVYIPAGGIAYAFTWIISGLWYDFLHAIGNGATALILYIPIYNILRRCKNL